MTTFIPLKSTVENIGDTCTQIRRLGWDIPTNNPGTGTKPKIWECFCDPFYYDMWCVRRKHERKFGQGFHINNGKEAQALTDLLNENEVA